MLYLNFIKMFRIEDQVRVDPSDMSISPQLVLGSLDTYFEIVVGGLTKFDSGTMDEETLTLTTSTLVIIHDDDDDVFLLFLIPPPQQQRRKCSAKDNRPWQTTLIDRLLRQSGTLKRLSLQEQLQLTPAASASSASDPGEAVTCLDNGFITRVMDSNDLEKERGITILSKCMSIMCKGTQINIVDTPGHADFGGEVEQIMSMVNTVALVVDATEGLMTQTCFVLSKALERGLKPVVVLNKADRPPSWPAQVKSNLFATLGATGEQMVYGGGV
ncbi:hypothetical protein D9758_009874 [Tetrapyrgos nigripes]|uniref:Tr-type G domain-containing protein n=1 Tax=Tetrapyrgos nigripes TaxID=182062 RepID=A0A8H5LSF2_9AGAR|nr:hypothetical protein D9758_009874 [Tetrapyrgos nigripes]